MQPRNVPLSDYTEPYSAFFLESYACLTRTSYLRKVIKFTKLKAHKVDHETGVACIKYNLLLSMIGYLFLSILLLIGTFIEILLRRFQFVNPIPASLCLTLHYPYHYPVTVPCCEVWRANNVKYLIQLSACADRNEQFSRYEWYTPTSSIY